MAINRNMFSQPRPGLPGVTQASTGAFGSRQPAVGGYGRDMASPGLQAAVQSQYGRSGRTAPFANARGRQASRAQMFSQRLGGANVPNVNRGYSRPPAFAKQGLQDGLIPNTRPDGLVQRPTPAAANYGTPVPERIMYNTSTQGIAGQRDIHGRTPTPVAANYQQQVAQLRANPAVQRRTPFLGGSYTPSRRY